MSESTAAKLNQLGITLPKPTPAAGTYSPYIISGNLVFISGQVPVGTSGLEFQGKVGDKFNVDQAKAAARLKIGRAHV